MALAEPTPTSAFKRLQALTRRIVQVPKAEARALDPKRKKGSRGLDTNGRSLQP